MKDALLVVRELTRPGLETSSFMLQPGEAIHISGASGAGKTLLLRAVADLDPNEGDVRLAGVARSEIPPPLWRRQVRYVAAEPAWWSDVVAEHFTALDDALELAPALGLDAGIFAKRVAGLSTGERQRLALLRALEREPKVLLLDEPTAALDSESTRRVGSLLRGLLRGGAALVVVAHDPILAEQIGGRRLRMAAGRLRPA